MRKLFIITFLIFSISCFAQDTKGTIKVKKVDTAKKDTVETSIIVLDEVSVIVRTPLTVVEKMPTYPGGQKEMDAFIQKNLKYSGAEKKGGNQGTVWVTFIVGVDGSISDIRLLKGINGRDDLSIEAVRVVRMMPKWNPGMQNGINVAVQFNLPIKFQL